MIFILLGIIILIVSFAVALASLVREQAKFERQVSSEKPQEAETLDKTQTVHSVLDDQAPAVAGETLATGQMPAAATQVGLQQQERPLVEEPQVANVEVPFWEKLAQKDSVWEGDSDKQKEIEQIRAELAKVQEQKIQRVQEEPGGVAAQEVLRPEAKKLSGQFSVSQLIKSAS